MSTERDTPPRVHELKCDPVPFSAIVHGSKSFELRRNDRDFKVGDVLVLRETVNPSLSMRHSAKLAYTGREARLLVGYVLYGPDFGIVEGCCVMSITDLSSADLRAEAAALRARLEAAERERDAAREEVRTHLLADEERRKLTGDALYAEGEAHELRIALGERTRAVALLREELERLHANLNHAITLPDGSCRCDTGRILAATAAPPAAMPPEVTP